MTSHINIISKLNGVGLDQDVLLLTQALQAQGFEVSFSQHKGLKSQWRFIQRSKKYDANIFIERIFPCWLGFSQKNFLIPNQERFPMRLLPKLKFIDAVLCKTKHAQMMFSPYINITKYIGFTSVDKVDDTFEKSYSSFFHLAGKSSMKGTKEILSLWSRHPEWPQLTVVQHPKNAPESVPANVTLYAERLSDDDISRLQNTIGIHLCPSLSEGWGHYIVEAMSTSAVTVTTAAEPMNELIDSCRGVLVKVNRSEKRHLGINYFVDVNVLEAEIERLIIMPEKQKEVLSQAARVWYTKSNEEFGPRIGAVLRDLLQELG